MTQVISDTQAQNNTSSTNGRNVMPTLKAESYFPIQTGSLAQTDSQCFGAQSTSSFRTTSKLTFTGNKKVYSICSGQVFFQPTEGDATKVNLVLKPFKQPIGGLPIKYIIYRGLNKSDFFNTDTEPKVVGDETTGTDFVQFIWTQFNKFYENDDPSETKPDFLAKFLGYSSSTDSDYKARLFDSFFYKVTEYTDEEMTTEDADTAFELPIIPMGLYLGEATGSVGIDIVLNDGDYYIPNDPNPFQYNITFARSADHSLETSTSNTAYENKLIKESCTKFIDLSAFFGLHANGDGKIHSKDSSETASIATEVDDIYGLISDFYTKNRIYLYIQANRQRSYNFYGNYKYDDTNIDNINIGVDENNLTTTDFDETGWPVYEYDGGSSLTLQLLTDNSETVALYVNIGTLNADTEHENNFLRNENILQQQDETGTIDLAYTKPISFAIHEDTSSNAVSTFIHIIYNGKQMIVEEYVDPNITPLPISQTLKVENNYELFNLLDASLFLTYQNSTTIEIVQNICKRTAFFEKNDSQLNMAIIQTKRVGDFINDFDSNTINKRVTYETLLDSIDLESRAYFKHASGSIDSCLSSTKIFNSNQNNFYYPTKPYYILSNAFTINNLSQTALLLLTTDGGLPTKRILGLSYDENQEILNFIESLDLQNISFGLLNLLDNNDYFISDDGAEYSLFNLIMIAENLNGEIKIYYPNNDILIYSIDSFIFFSLDYSKFSILEKKSQYTILKNI